MKKIERLKADKIEDKKEEKGKGENVKKEKKLKG